MPKKIKPEVAGPESAGPEPSRREEILEAMLDLVVEQGLQAPMSALAKRSRASPGVIYHYFPSKDELIRAIYQRVRASKRDILLEGVRAEMPPREALLLVWLNAYRFYRTHLRETRFLDQYLNSPYCSPAGDAEEADSDFAPILKLLQPKKKGGVMKDLPQEAVTSLTLGLAADLAKAPRAFSKATLMRIAETVWAAVAEESE
ncbi:TetR/AcrR family transcriptional regulator [Occallatibacter riparius]|uniref:TetR/AcrR family transcriptional regulator n=1 Tax=Occallatibacter riparius TaxID=1002689 RepID=A0A9J7BM31_9BACT|nr:TetR/AcrR family transcriptional regulator [Occallatibacter riparius]UWZ81966.1 TetR/AcrR family transcriptional regulator [Occallatibacter riparius]